MRNQPRDEMIVRSIVAEPHYSTNVMIAHWRESLKEALVVYGKPDDAIAAVDRFLGFTAETLGHLWKPMIAEVRNVRQLDDQLNNVVQHAALAVESWPFYSDASVDFFAKLQRIEEPASTASVSAQLRRFVQTCVEPYWGRERAAHLELWTTRFTARFCALVGDIETMNGRSDDSLRHVLTRLAASYSAIAHIQAACIDMYVHLQAQDDWA